MVRLVKACGSKHVQGAVDKFNQMVRLVRACGLRFYWRKEVWIPGIRDRQMKSVSRN